MVKYTHTNAKKNAQTPNQKRHRLSYANYKRSFNSTRIFQLVLLILAGFSISLSTGAVLDGRTKASVSTRNLSAGRNMGNDVRLAQALPNFKFAAKPIYRVNTLS